MPTSASPTPGLGGSTAASTRVPGPTACPSCPATGRSSPTPAGSPSLAAADGVDPLAAARPGQRPRGPARDHRRRQRHVGRRTLPQGRPTRLGGHRLRARLRRRRRPSAHPEISQALSEAAQSPVAVSFTRSSRRCRGASSPPVRRGPQRRNRKYGPCMRRPTTMSRSSTCCPRDNCRRPRR